MGQCTDREMAQGLRVYTSLEEESSAIPSIHVKRLTTAYNSSSRGSNALFWLPQALHLNAHNQAHAHSLSLFLSQTHTHTPQFFTYFKLDCAI